ncbi:MAG: hypothetical protein JWN27_3341 [Candidatus Eremiobacteraeota bacterium]|nr:hypothetical protein [Candidatus Eremiobacteraeota bacterium]
MMSRMWHVMIFDYFARRYPRAVRDQGGGTGRQMGAWPASPERQHDGGGLASRQGYIDIFRYKAQY